MVSEPQVFIVGGYGAGNLGDDLLADTVYNFITALGIRAQICAGEFYSGLSPARTAARPRIVRDIRRGDLLLLGGGGLINDDLGIDYLRYFASLAIAAKLKGARVAAAGVGIEGLATRQGRLLARLLLKACYPFGVRDRMSAARADHLAARPTTVGLDLAWLVASSPRFDPPRDRALISFAAESATAVERRLETLAEAIRAIKLRRPSVEFIFVPMQTDARRLHDDRSWLADIEDRSGTSIEVLPVTSYRDVLNFARTCTISIGFRLHALLLSYIAGCSVLALSRSEKVRSQFLDAPNAEIVEVERFVLGSDSLDHAVSRILRPMPPTVQTNYVTRQRAMAHSYLAKILESFYA